MLRRAEYIWIDGAVPTRKLRSKTRVLCDSEYTVEGPQDQDDSTKALPEWGFDGSSTAQADGHDSDLALKPVCSVEDPLRGPGNYLVLCEVNNGDGTPHASNTRAMLRDTLDKGASDVNSWFGFEQEYTFLQGTRPLGWPEVGYPAPQGPFYCGVGSEEVFGRDLVEEHTEACMLAGLLIFGTNAEVMPGQWEYQIGYRGLDGDVDADPLTVSDHLWLARWLMHRLGEEHDVSVSLDPKPVKGDWNGAGAHANFSTEAMRDPATGKSTYMDAIEKLGARHEAHIKVYGHDLGARLTGEHETCSISDFRAGDSDRGASIRIPRHVHEKGCGYIEDRRPGANCDPYEVCHMILETVVLGVTA